MANPNSSTLRISKLTTQELRDLEQNPNPNLSFCVSYSDDDILTVRAIIVGPPETPYEFGFFEIDYPRAAPKVTALTTNYGQCRFNPNIYAEGKVCFTWQGESGESWSSAQGLESVLLSIQSLLSAKPYENEPGYRIDSDSHASSSEQYNKKIRHETLRLAVITPLEKILDLHPNQEIYQVRDPDPDAPRALFGSYSAATLVNQDLSRQRRFRELYESENDEAQGKRHDRFHSLYKIRFLWYYSTYMKRIAEARQIEGTADSSPFSRMPFEHHGNKMSGRFHYDDLEKRLVAIRTTLEAQMTEAMQRQTLIIHLTPNTKVSPSALPASSSSATASFSTSSSSFSATTSFSSTSSSMSTTSTVEATKGGYDSLYSPGYMRSKLGTVQNRFIADELFHTVSAPEGNPYNWTIAYMGGPEGPIGDGILSIHICWPEKFPDQMPMVAIRPPIYHSRIAVPSGILVYTPAEGRSDDIMCHVLGILHSLEYGHKYEYNPMMVGNLEAHQLLWGSAEEPATVKNKQRYNSLVRRAVQETLEG